MDKVSGERVRSMFNGKRVAIVGSGPGCLDNTPGYIDAFDVVCRINNFALSIETGYRCDVFYSFFGGSIVKSIPELKKAGVKLCICKCPDGQFMESEWHRRNGKQQGVDFSYIYRNRRDWWFVPVYVPELPEFVRVFEMLDRHIPSTGFSAIVKILECEPAETLITGFDWFSSKIHNVTEPWRPGNPDDPIGHAPELERAWLKKNMGAHKILMDRRLTEIMMTE